MDNYPGILRTLAALLLSFALSELPVNAQERIKLDYSSADASNSVWFTAQDRGFFKKHGLDSQLIFIPSTTTAVASIIAGDVAVGNAAGSGVASADVAGANLLLVGCFLNTLPYELVVQESIKSAEDLRGKSVGISRVGSASDVAARVLIKGLGLEPVKDVPILQVGGATERAGAFRTGRIGGFPSPPGIIELAQGMPHRVIISTADFQKRFEFPYICATTTRPYLSAHRDTVRRVLMALIEATAFFKNNKEEGKKVIAKYSRQNNPAYLESSYATIAKLYDRVPLVTHDGTEVQIKEALALSRKPAGTIRFEDIADDSLVREIEKTGFIDKLYR
jgi:NitT/TauT family transport system substrate-binding protein